MMLAAMDTTIVSTAIPQIVGDLGGLRLFSWVFSIYLLTQTVTIPIYGKLSDLFGRKPVLIAGTLIFLAGSAASSLSWDMPSLIAFRGLQGLGAGAIMATVSTLAGDLYAVHERGAVQGWLSSVWGMAAIAGPLLGGAFAEYASWRWIFLINLPIGALTLVLIGIFLQESFERRRPRIDYAGSLFVLAAVGTLIFGLLQGGQTWPWLSLPMMALLALTVVLLLLTVWAERRAAEPVLPGWLWRLRAISGSNLAVLGMGMVMMAPSAYLPVFLQSVQGLGAIGAGFVLSSMSLGWPPASALSGPLYMRFGFRDTALAGAIMILLASAAFGWMPRPQPVWMVVVDQVVLGAGFGLLSTPLLVGVQSVVGWGAARRRHRRAHVFTLSRAKPRRSDLRGDLQRVGQPPPGACAGRPARALAAQCRPGDRGAARARHRRPGSRLAARFDRHCHGRPLHRHDHPVGVDGARAAGRAAPIRAGRQRRAGAGVSAGAWCGGGGAVSCAAPGVTR